MTSSNSLSHLIETPKKSSITSTRSAEVDPDRRVNFVLDVEKKHSLSEESKLTKKDSFREATGWLTRRSDISKDSQREKAQSPVKRESCKEGSFKEQSRSTLTKKDSSKDLGKRDSLKDVTNKGEVPRKFISTWKMACDKTKDRTKELLKKWRTVPEGSIDDQDVSSSETNDYGWSVHVWTTWVKRYPNDDDKQPSEDTRINHLSQVQKDKLEHFFAHVFDMDRDDIISLQDFESFTERVRHFADWSTNCGEYIVLQQVQQGFVEGFLLPEKSDDSDTEDAPVNLDRLFLSLDLWLIRWSDLLHGVRAIMELPVWLQYLPKVLFHAINTSGTGKITKEELMAFYSSIMGFQKKLVNDMLDNAYRAMTANGDYELTYPIYELCFANMLLGRNPNGPGGYIFGYEPRIPIIFPIDYTAMNSSPEDLEHYSPGKKSNRSSVIV